MPKFSRAFLCVLVMLLVAPAHAAEKLRVGKAVAFAWTFTPLDIGIQTGIFAKHGLEIEASDATGDAKLQQALTAKTVDDLKGKKLGVTTVGSLTDWIGKRINALKGWGAEGITTVPIGGMPPARAAIKTGQIDGYIGALETGYALEEAKEWRVITTATPFVDDFITHVFFVRDDVIAKRPEAVRAFLKGWFETIAFMKANKDKTVEITSKVLNLSPAVITRAYDEQIPIFSTDGTFDPKAVVALKQSFIEMGLLKEMPDDKVMFTTQFVPVKAGM